MPRTTAPGQASATSRALALKVHNQERSAVKVRHTMLHFRSQDPKYSELSPVLGYETGCSCTGNQGWGMSDELLAWIETDTVLTPFHRCFANYGLLTCFSLLGPQYSPSRIVCHRRPCSMYSLYMEVAIEVVSLSSYQPCSLADLHLKTYVRSVPKAESPSVSS